MTERDMNILTISLLLLFIMSTIGCARPQDVPYEVKTIEYCSVSKVDAGALITCPDGSEIVLPPEIINNVIEVPITVIVKKDKDKCHLPQNDNRHHDDK